MGYEHVMGRPDQVWLPAVLVVLSVLLLAAVAAGVRRLTRPPGGRTACRDGQIPGDLPRRGR